MSARTSTGQITVANIRLVAVADDKIVVQRPAAHMTRCEALNLAAWLVSLADDDDEFQELLKKVQNT
jgi:hypothetical protein